MKNHARMAAMTIAATPPTTPPTMAPMWDGDGVGVGAGEELLEADANALLPVEVVVEAERPVELLVVGELGTIAEDEAADWT
jgi:hypothetical protein